MHNGFEQAAECYLISAKGWKREDFVFEKRGLSPDGKCEIIKAVFLNDALAGYPGAGQSVDLHIDKISGLVACEVGGQ
jgi:hypothetical protein